MAFSYTGGDTDRVTVTAAASINTLVANTACIWFWHDGAPAGNRQLLTKDFSSGVRIMAGWENSGPNFWISVPRATSFLDCLAVATNFASYGTNKWLYGAFVIDTAGADGDQKMYIGDLSTTAAEPSSYGTRGVGSGTVTSDAAGNLILGNRSAVNISWNGDIASIMLYNSALTQAQLLAQQWSSRPLFSGCVGFYRLGWQGTSSVIDLSGTGNHSASTSGVTIADHVPLGPPFGFTSGWQGAFTAAAGGLSIPIAAYHYNHHLGSMSS